MFYNLVSTLGIFENKNMNFGQAGARCLKPFELTSNFLITSLRLQKLTEMTKIRETDGKGTLFVVFSLVSRFPQMLPRLVLFIFLFFLTLRFIHDIFLKYVFPLFYLRVFRRKSFDSISSFFTCICLCIKLELLSCKNILS